MLHAGASDLWTAWDWEPGIVTPLVLSAALYARGLRLLWDEHVGRGIRVWEATSFAAGWLVAAVALLTPIHALAEQRFSVHMVQHELLMVVAAPLLVLGRPIVPMLWALPSNARRFVGRASRRDAMRAVSGFFTRPIVAFLVHGAAIWIWHAPPLYQATLTSDAMHALQHLSFFGTALLFWWTILHGDALSGRSRAMSFGVAVLLLFGTALHSGALGALLTFSRTLWYPAYASACQGACLLTPLEDQQLAGLIMWIPAGFAYLVAALILFASWLRASEDRVHERELARDAQWTASATEGDWS
ncbi:MAG TPA: cytochrome c oxidase assembly protein [Gemmatimonadaceae bacterium]|jgi:cytochrome c oxidase assembly factor CtaG